jgi:hypothetical protein
MKVFLMRETTTLCGIPNCLLVFQQSPTDDSGKIDGNEHTHRKVLLAK